MAALDRAWWARRVEAADDGAALSAPGPLTQPPKGGAWLPSRAPPTTALGVLIDNAVVRAAAPLTRTLSCNAAPLALTCADTRPSLPRRVVCAGA
jgi:hypothetical protein